MNKNDARLRIEKLKKEVEHHRYLYHVLDKQEISDAALDSLKKELADYETQFPQFLTSDSPSLRVSGKPLENFFKVQHTQPILSLEDAFGFEDLVAWQSRNQRLLPQARFSYFAELKYDGLAVVLRYENGVFAQGATRGDGRVGEDVTQNLRTVESLPLKIKVRKNDPKVIEVRGEILLSKKNFEKINVRLSKEGKTTYANPRNLAAGTIRQLNPQAVSDRKLDCMVFEILTDVGQKTHADVHHILAQWGFKTSQETQQCKDLPGAQEFLTHWEKRRATLPYMTDGAVIVVDDIGYEKKLGSVGKAERWMIAYKFPAEQATTIVEKIQVQVGRTGALTPVALLRPVKVAGSTVSRATLHNEDEIKRLGLKIGDTVIIQKAGDIIPDIVSVLPGLRTGKEKSFSMPKTCPVCGAPVERKDGEVAHYCTNKQCNAKTREQFYHFVSKAAVDIDGLGPKIVDQLLDMDLVRDVSDLYTLTAGDLEPLERFAEKSASNLIVAIQERRKIPLHRFLFGLGLRHVGSETAFLLVSVLAGKRLERPKALLEEMETWTPETLENIEGIGPIVAQSIVEDVHDAFFKRLIQKLDTVGVRLEVPSARAKGKFSGKTFVLTGTLSSLTREEATEKIRDLGGQISSSVSSKTDFVLAGDNPGSKYHKAKKIGVTVLSEKEFLGKIRK